MRVRFPLVLLLLSGPVLGTGCSEGEAGIDERVEVVRSLDGDLDAGAELFESETCSSAACHGGGAPALDDRLFMASSETLDEITRSLLRGKGDMPPQDDLADQELADALAYVGFAFGE